MKTWKKNFVECYRKDWLYLRGLLRQSTHHKLKQYIQGDKRECEKARVRYLQAIRDH